MATVRRKSWVCHGSILAMSSSRFFCFDHPLNPCLPVKVRTKSEPSILGSELRRVRAGADNGTTCGSLFFVLAPGSLTMPLVLSDQRKLPISSRRVPVRLVMQRYSCREGSQEIWDFAASRRYDK